ncbi:MAG TPA: heme exporter protein CcmB [Aggregatilineales bacterium]|nr:heme exporter protein CcmB [Aggregatilineales bacterium]
MKTSLPRAIYAIVMKDLRAELRSRQVINATGLFALIATMVFYFTLSGRPDVRLAALPAVLWVIVVFAGTLGLARSLALEHDRGTLDGLLLAPIDRVALYYGKLLSTWLFSLIVSIIVSFALMILFNADLISAAWGVVLLFGTGGFAAVGTLIGTMTVGARGRETTLPILILPIALPIIMASVNASSAILTEQPFSDWNVWLLTLISVDLIYLGLAALLFGFVVEE